MPVSPPDLNNPSLFECRPGVPILDVHRRGDWVVDRDRLQLVCDNSNRRASAGELAQMLIGHTTDGGKETDQPPPVGFLQNYRLSQWDGRDCIVADLYYDRGKADEAFSYPRRSVEAYYSDDRPANNYIDALALLRRSPARNLGLVTYSKSKTLERYAMPDETPTGPSITEADIPDLIAFMEQNRISDTARGVKAFLAAKADGTAKPDPDAFTGADIKGVEQYAKARNIDLTRYGAYEATVERYKADKKAGTLHRGLDQGSPKITR